MPNAIDGFIYNGQLYGVPLAVENIGFFRNTELVPEAPATWAEVEEVGQALFDEGAVDTVIGFPDLTYDTYPVYTSYAATSRAHARQFHPDDIGMKMSAWSPA